MGAAAPLTAVSSLASIGLSAIGTVNKGGGDKAAAEFKAARAEEAAKFGRLQAELTDTTLQERLNSVNADVAAIRAQGNLNPASPTGLAVEDRNELRSDRQRIAALTTGRSQAASDEAGARYLRQAGDFALSQSYLQAGIEAGGKLAKLSPSPFSLGG